VAVDLGSGAVTVTSEAPLTDAQVREAVDEAGYELASA
jgi:copper chaperone CopZ